MKAFDPFAPQAQKPEDAILFAGLSVSPEGTKESYFSGFNNECVVLSESLRGYPHGDTAARFATETALWGYKLVRTKLCYWSKKELFIRRIFRSTNLALWQKKREAEFAAGIGVSLAVVIYDVKKFWVGSVGVISILLYRDGLIDEVTPLDEDESGHIATRALGFQRLGLKPNISMQPAVCGDTLLIATPEIMNNISEDDVRVAFEVSGSDGDGLRSALIHIIEQAKSNGGNRNMTACMIKRVTYNTD